MTPPEELLQNPKDTKIPKSVSMEDSPCPLGCSGDDEIVLIGRDRLHHLPGEFTVVKCRSCGLIRTSPRPAADSIGFYYPEDYGPYIGTRIEEPQFSRFSGIKNLLRPAVQRLFNTKSEELPSMYPTQLLEIGCASGSFLHKMVGAGWQVEGIEFSEAAAAAARQLGFRVHTGSLENAPAPENPPDLIVGWMVLEHLHNPIESLTKLHGWANPGAWLVLSVPNAKSWEFRIFKENWYALQLPNHLYHFTPDTLAKVLKSTGWSLRKVHHQRSVANLMMSTTYVLESKGWARSAKWLRDIAGRGGVWFYILFPFGWFLSVFGQTGRMTVWAKRNVESPRQSTHQSSTTAAT
jgi:2-polyprenyl-3-methyl-5-hydroxy-6-metoxy-1,4-benzoquinol methylase